MLSFATFRLAALATLTLFSLVEFVVAAVVVPYELRTYGGYNASAAELAFAGGLTFIMVPIVTYIIRVRDGGWIARVWFECAWCALVWFLYIGGLAALTSETFRLQDCQNLLICRGFSTMLGFAWLCWITVSLFAAAELALIVRRWSADVWSMNAVQLWGEGWWRNEQIQSVGGVKERAGEDSV